MFLKLHHNNISGAVRHGLVAFSVPSPSGRGQVEGQMHHIKAATCPRLQYRDYCAEG